MVEVLRYLSPNDDAGNQGPLRLRPPLCGSVVANELYFNEKVKLPVAVYRVVSVVLPVLAMALQSYGQLGVGSEESKRAWLGLTVVQLVFATWATVAILSFYQIIRVRRSLPLACRWCACAGVWFPLLTPVFLPFHHVCQSVLVRPVPQLASLLFTLFVFPVQEILLAILATSGDTEAHFDLTIVSVSNTTVLNSLICFEALLLSFLYAYAWGPQHFKVDAAAGTGARQWLTDDIVLPDPWHADDDDDAAPAAATAAAAAPGAGAGVGAGTRISASSARSSAEAGDVQVQVASPEQPHDAPLIA